MKTRSCSLDPVTSPTVLGRWLLLSFWLAAAGLPARAAQFQDVTTAAGITSVTGCGVAPAWGDYDNDGQIDLYLAIGLDGVATNALFRNDGDGTFTRQHAEAGPIGTDRHDSIGCAWIDFNNDGYRDMLVINGGFSASRCDLYLNAGKGTFNRHNAGPLTDLALLRGWSACADYDGDGFVDIHLAELLSMSGPANFMLYRGSASATFQADPRNPLPNLAMANSAVWGDFDNDGDPDLFTCNYTSPSILWRNDGLCQFTQMANGLPSSGTTFSAAWADFDNDGDLDIALSGFRDMNSTTLFRNNGIDDFASVTTLAGVNPGWTDYDNNGHADLLLAATHKGSQVRPGLYHNNGDGTFATVSDIFVTDYWSNPAWGDYDNDGFMDVVICHQQGVNRLYRNLGDSNHWLKFQLVGTTSNRDAIGAKIRLQATIGGQSFWQMQEVNGGYMLQNDTMSTQTN